MKGSEKIQTNPGKLRENWIELEESERNLENPRKFDSPKEWNKNPKEYEIMWKNPKGYKRIQDNPKETKELRIERI